MGGYASCSVLWLVVLQDQGTIGAVANGSTETCGCFWVCSWDHIHWVCHLPSQNHPTQSWAPTGFTITYLDLEASLSTFVCGLLLNYWCWRGLWLRASYCIILPTSSYIFIIFVMVWWKGNVALINQVIKGFFPKCWIKFRNKVWVYSLLFWEAFNCTFDFFNSKELLRSCFRF